LGAEELSTYTIDSELKEILRNHKNAEIIEKISHLLPVVGDPRNFQDELSLCLEDDKLMIPTMMLIYQLNQYFNFECPEFHSRLETIITMSNIQSESLLLFVLRCLKNREIDLDVVIRILKKLSELSIALPSPWCTRIIYSMLLIMRMHPATFRYVDELKELNILMMSFDSVAKIVSRIFIEANNPNERKGSVQVDNILFPEFMQ
jgi:hypothetical protein